MNVGQERYVATGSASVPPPRRRKRWPWILAVVLVLFVGVFVVTDRVTVGIAEEKVAEAIVDSTSEYNTTADKTQVDIKGFPFLTQVASGKFGDVDVTMRDVRVQQFALLRLDAKLHTVRVPRSVMTGSDAEDIKVDKVLATGVISPREFAAALNVPQLTLRAEDGILHATGFVAFAGLNTQIDAKLRPFLNQDRIGLELLELNTGEGFLTEKAMATVRSYLAQGVVAPRLPFEVALTDIESDGENIRISGEARNVFA